MASYTSFKNNRLWNMDSRLRGNDSVCGKANAAFTLVELAVVLTIIALLAGAVVAGTKIKQNADLASIISEVQVYRKAVDDFRAQYEGWPGDMVNATDFWTTAVNGNGDGLLSNVSTEYMQAWNQLGNAKLVPGDYNGTQHGISNFCSGCGFYFHAHTTAMWTRAASSENSLSLVVGGMFNGYSLSPVNARSIDKKIDDGIGTRGKVVSFSSTVGDCIKQTNGTTNADYANYTAQGDYSLSQTDKTCVPVFYW